MQRFEGRFDRAGVGSVIGLPYVAVGDSIVRKPTVGGHSMASNQLAVVKDKVQRYLTDLLQNVQIDREGDFNFRHGSAHVFVRVAPIGDEHTFVAVWAHTNLEVPASPELYQYIATGNQFRFGYMKCREEDGKVSIVFAHHLLGDFLDPDELKTTVVLVAQTADQIDDEIMTKFGGRRFHEG